MITSAMTQLDMDSMAESFRLNSRYQRILDVALPRHKRP